MLRVMPDEATGQPPSRHAAFVRVTHFVTTIQILLLVFASIALCQQSEDLLAVQSQVGPGYGFINRSGKIVLPGPYQGGASFSEGLAPINVDGEWAYIDTTGRVVIANLRVITAGGFVEGRAYVEDFTHHYGFIDRTGRMVVPITYEAANNRDIFQFAEGRVPVLVDGKWGYLDTQGEFTIPPQYDEASGFQNGVACVRSGSQTMYIDPSGAVVLATRLFAMTFRGGPLAPVKVGDKWGYIDKKGEIAIVPQYERAAPFTDGLAAVKQGGRWSFIRSDGTIAFTTDAELVREFSDGLVVVREGDGKWNYLNKMGQKLSRTGFQTATDFSDGVAKTDIGYIDTSGKFFWKGPW